MKYKVNTEGIEALRALQKSLRTCVDQMSSSASSLSSAVSGNSAGAGPHYDEIIELTEQITDKAEEIEDPVDEVSEMLEDLAEAYEEIINRKLRRNGSASSADGGLSGSGTSASANSTGSGSSSGGQSHGGSEIPLKFSPVQFEGTVKVDGETRDVSRKVYQRNDIDFDYTDETTGLTNLERMQKGKPPIGADGKPIQLHHVLQKEPGPMAEILEMTHQDYYGVLHGLVGDGSSFRNDPVLKKQYNNFRIAYWKWRAQMYLEGRG